MSSNLGSAELPPVGSEDHVRGEGPEVTLYLDLGCPHCAAVWARIRELALRLCFRHFPVASKHPRAPALHAAAEAAAAQGRFWDMCDSIYLDQGHIDDPHLWERARTLELDLERFERERRSDAVAGRVRRDFESGIRAGVVGTPAAFVYGRLIGDEIGRTLASLALTAD
ncbi:MAG: DsbA family protein [Solirubrobacterales bacterium]